MFLALFTVLYNFTPAAPKPAAAHIANGIGIKITFILSYLYISIHQNTKKEYSTIYPFSQKPMVLKAMYYCPILRQKNKPSFALEGLPKFFFYSFIILLVFHSIG